MSIKICVYKGLTTSCIKPEDIPPLENIPQLPWAHNDRYCIGGKAPRYASCQNMKWKLVSSMTQIVPSNSRPVPLRRNWHAPSRPLPSLSADPGCNTSAGPCDIDMNNTPLSDGPPIMNDEEYLSYNNPSHINGKVWFYNGPGWKISRVHGKSKSRPLPRPIKHWRKQLFPRQKLDVATGQPFPPILPVAGTLLDNTNGGRSGRLSVIDRPGGAITIDSSMVTQLYEAGELNNTSCIPLYFPQSQLITSCDRLRELGDCVRSLDHSRPGLNVKFNKYSFSSSKMYLQSRARLHHQQATIQFNSHSNLPVLGWQGAIIPPPNPGRPLPPSSVSLFLKDSSGCFINTDCSCVVPVAFKPRNTAFARDAAVSSSTNIKRKKRSAITRDQYNVTNKWGIGSNDTLKHWPMEEFKTRGKRRGGSALSSWCCEDPDKSNWHPVPPTPPFLKTFLVSMDLSSWYELLNVNIDIWAWLPIKAESANKSYTYALPGTGYIIFNITYTDSDPIGDAKEYGFTMYDALAALNGQVSGGKHVQYPLNILNWGGVPFVANTDGKSSQFSAATMPGGPSTAKWTGTIYATDKPALNPTTSLWSAFEGVTIPDISFGCDETLGTATHVMQDWNVEHVSNMHNTFRGATNFNQPIGTWNTANVIDMSGMFYDATNFNQELPWDTVEVTNMSHMFHNATKFNQELPWDTAGVKNMSYMFDGATSFNKELPWNTAKVENMAYMFHNAKIFNQNLSPPL